MSRGLVQYYENICNNAGFGPGKPLRLYGIKDKNQNGKVRPISFDQKLPSNGFYLDCLWKFVVCSSRK